MIISRPSTKYLTEPDEQKKSSHIAAIPGMFDKSVVKPRLHKQVNMERIKKIVFATWIILLFLPSFAMAGQKKGTSATSNFDWTPVMEAIIHVESHGNANARSGNSVGVMQITPILVAECNQILKRRNSKKRYKLSDRLSVAKSKEMFLLIQSVYNPNNNVEKAIRSWNGGPNYSNRSTHHYFKKVMKVLRG